MNSSIRFILIGNYVLDKQESMQRFAYMLNSGIISKDIDSKIWNPTVFLGGLFKSTNRGIGKWVAYVDKYIIFPFILIFKSQYEMKNDPNLYFHICDHSNAPYLKFLPKDRTSITCHDVLAIRGALGFQDAYALPSKFGYIFQRWILKHLKRAIRLAAVSEFSLNQLKALSENETNKEKWVVISNAFNAPFSEMNKESYNVLLSDMNLRSEEPFILHVGTAHPRKNRLFLLHVLHEMRNEWNGKLCLASKPLDKEFTALAKQLNLSHRIVSVVRPDHNHLVALYSACEAFVFPSLSEGFGWPVIEAQACGAPVIASNFDPMPEVSGGAAIHAHPKDAKAFAAAILSLKDEGLRKKLIESGFKNIERFQVDSMIESYLKLYTDTN